MQNAPPVTGVPRPASFGAAGAAATTARERATGGWRAAAGELWRCRRWCYGREGTFAFPTRAERATSDRRTAACRRCRYGREGSFAFPARAERTIDGWRAAAGELWCFRCCHYSREGSLTGATKAGSFADWNGARRSKELPHSRGRHPDSEASRTVATNSDARSATWNGAGDGSEELSYSSGHRSRHEASSRTIATHAGSAADGNDANRSDELSPNWGLYAAYQTSGTKRSGSFVNGNGAGRPDDPNSDRESSHAAATENTNGKAPRSDELSCDRGPHPADGASCAIAEHHGSRSPTSTQHATATLSGFDIQDNSTGKWAACVLDPVDTSKIRRVGAFPDEHAAALAHDRLDIAFHGAGARVNFNPAFHGVERQFLKLSMAQKVSPADGLCRMVADGTYDEKYSQFLRRMYDGVMNKSRCKLFTSVILEFFIHRASEIGTDAIIAGGPRLVERFVAMHKNKATSPAWREWYSQKMAQAQAQNMSTKQQQQQDNANKRKADGEDDRENKRQELSTETTQVTGT
ncbi:hypothetical protein E2562_019481 [Oryza meyeriana var. granulata]|uniref:AP2/ERF domain-containing protein n=1 Tax=Oryza meyeriana var. granulata TaxID=110450 RepID=A0A6G1DKG4_9ORYZ|nr:hypothetical protein E2562_019481 [Oryza meyeriana var. granulata]